MLFNFIIVLKRIIYIDNFLAHHGYSPTTGYTLVPLLQKEGFEVTIASDKKNQLLRLLHMLYTILKHRSNAVVLIATYSTSAFYFACSCGWLCRILHIAYIPCLHGGNLPERIRISPQLVKDFFSKSIINIAVSEYLQQALLNEQWRCIVIPNAIDTAQYPYKQRMSAQPKLLWVRSFHEVYNPQMAVRVLYELQKIYSNAVLTMVGPDKDGSREDCVHLAKQLGVEAYVNFTGKLSQKEWAVLAVTHDIFVNTTTTDNLPVSVIEAMALGMIVVSANVGGIPFLIQDGVNGLLCAINNTEDMANKVVQVCKDETLAQALSKQAYITSRQYDEKVVIKQWKDLLNMF